MKDQTLSLSLCSLLIFAVAAVGQTSPPDSRPAIQGPVGYTMPQAAIDAEIGGTVMLGVRVDERGKVEKVWLVAGPMWPCGKTPGKAIDKLKDSLSDTIKAVKFTPAIKGGKPITENIAVTLKLENPNIEAAAFQANVISGKPQPKLVSMGVVNGKALSLPKPAYPQEARAIRAGGTVSVQILIDEEGQVKRAGAVSGIPELQYAARDAACGARFSPTTLEGKAVKVTGIVTYNFVPGAIR